MQKRENIVWRRVSGVMAASVPVMVARWWVASRTSCATKSAERPVVRAPMARERAAEVLRRAV